MVLRVHTVQSYVSDTQALWASLPIVMTAVIKVLFFFDTVNSNVVTAHTALKLTLRRLMSYIYGAPILDVSRSHTTTQHSR